MFYVVQKKYSMKRLFYLGVIGLLLFEIANVYFIMPMPGSQRMNSIGLAYTLHKWRWLFRGLFIVMIGAGLLPAYRKAKVWPTILLLLLLVVGYMANFKMSADAMFKQPQQLIMIAAAHNKVDMNRLVIGIEHNGEAKAYPVQYIGYHHQVRDTVGGKPVMVTYCTVCRTGRVFEPVVNGKTETFRLVGMDHFNAMFEDKTTKSWWRQSTGEAVAGKLKGKQLPEFPSTQMTLGQWFALHPNTTIMQPDPTFTKQYAQMDKYESGGSKSFLTKRDTASWQEKSWVVGVQLGSDSKTYDWNKLRSERIIYDTLNNQPVVILLAADNSSFSALQRTAMQQKFTMINDTLFDGQNKYNLLGKPYNPAVPALKKLTAYQEYWHSWRTFHPATKKY